MFANKGRLKVALLVVGVLVVGLGWYVGFQPHDAHADGTHTRVVVSDQIWETDSYTWTFVSYLDTCLWGGQLIREREWKTTRRKRMIFGTFYHADGSLHRDLLWSRLLSIKTVDTGNRRTRCKTHGFDCIMN